MSSRIQFAGIAIVILLVSLALRFHGLGNWPFAGDEVATLWEEQVMFHGAQAAQNSQAYRLPRVIPLSYSILHLSHTLFGSAEFGTRALLAILGAVSVVLTFLALDGLLGRPTAIAVSVLVGLWPEHIFQSQQTRFYIIVAFFSYLAVLNGALALKRNAVLYSTLSCMCAIAAMLSHTVMAVVLPMVFIAFVLGSYAEHKTVSKASILVYLLAGALMTLLIVFHVLPLLRGWNQGESWGYSALHAILASVVSIGWPMILLAAVGALLMLGERNAQNWYWLTCFIGWAAGTVFLPSVVVYHPAYVFPLAISVFVLAGFAIATIYTYLRAKNSVAAVLWVAVACAGNLPSLASHYVDGSRWDLRGAAEFIKKNWAPGDRVTGYSMGTFRYYAAGCCEPTIPLNFSASHQLGELARAPGRLWVVVESSRGGLPEDTKKWLFDNSSHKFQIRRRRFDYAEYSVDLFLYTP